MKQPKKPRRKDRPKLFAELWGLGLTDSAIGERMGISTNAVSQRRFRYGMAVNPEAGSVPSAVARAINAQPWEPPAGATKQRCAMCLYWFSAWEENARFCPECRIITSRGS